MPTAQGIAVLSFSFWPETPPQPTLHLCQVTALSLPLCCDPLNGTFVIRKAFASSQGATARATCQNCHPSWWSSRTVARKLSQRRRQMVRRSVEKVSDKGLVRIRGRNHDGEDRRVKSAKDGGVSLRRGAHEAELGDVISEVVSRSGRVARPLEFPS